MFSYCKQYVFTQFIKGKSYYVRGSGYSTKNKSYPQDLVVIQETEPKKKKKDYYGLTSCDKCSTEDEQGYKIANWWISLQLYMKGLKGCNWTRYLKS